MTRQDMALLLTDITLGGLAVDSKLPDIMHKVATMSDTDFLALCEMCTGEGKPCPNLHGVSVATLNALCHLRDLGHFAGFAAREGAQ